MKKSLVSLLLLGAQVAVANIRLDYVVHVQRNDHARTVCKFALLGGLGGLANVGSVVATLGGLGAPADIINNPGEVVNTVTGTATTVTNNPVGVASGTVGGVVGQSPVPIDDGGVQNVLNVAGSLLASPLAVVGQASALVGNPLGLLTNPTAILNDPTAVVQTVEDLLVGIDLVQQAESIVDLVFTVAQKKLDGSLLPLAQLPVVAQLDKEEVIQAVLDNVNGIQSIVISLVASPLSSLN